MTHNQLTNENIVIKPENSNENINRFSSEVLLNLFIKDKLKESDNKKKII